MANLTDIYKKASLVMKPAAMKEGKLYSQQPHSGAGDFTFSRANGVQTRINEHGLIESVADNTPRLSYDLVTKEEARTNFNSNSDYLSESYSKVGSPVSSEKALISPNGILEASEQTIASIGNGYYKFPTSVVSGQDYTVSAFFKYTSGGEIVRFGAAGGTFGGDQANRINIRTGAIDFQNTGNTITVEEYTGGWYRISCTKGAISSGSGGFSLFTHEANMVFGLWGVQLEQSSSATEYIPTGVEAVTIPAVVVASECPTLLLEPTRTNETTYSEDFTQTSYWNNIIGASVSTNQGVAPDGSYTANKIQSYNGRNYNIVRKGAFTIPSGVTMSMFVKRGNYDYITFKAQGDYNLNLSTLEWDSDYGDNVGYELYPDGWIRLYATTEASQNAYFGIYLSSSSFTQLWDSTGDEFVYAWGAQYETGEYTTSYIPTEGSTGVSNADSSALGNSQEIIGQTEGVLFFDFENYGQVGTSYSNHVKIESEGNNDRVAIQSDAAALNRLIFVIHSGSTLFFQPREDISLGRNKIAIKYKSGDVAVYINGVKEQSSTTSFSFANTLDNVYLGVNSQVNELSLFNEALSDSELITLTT